MTHWFLIRTAASKERLAAHLLEARGFETYCPMRRVWRRPSRYARRREKVLKEYALLPRYLFVGFKPESCWLRLFEPACVLSWVGFDGTPCQVSNRLIDAMKDRFGDSVTGPVFHRWMRANAEFNTGDMVRIVEGPLVQAFGHQRFKVEEIQGKAAVIGLKLFGGGGNVKVPLEQLESAA